MASKPGPAQNQGNVTDIADARRKSQKKKAATTSGDQSNRKQLNRTFDHQKVADIKAAIAAGTYKINAQSIADKFIERENP